MKIVDINNILYKEKLKTKEKIIKKMLAKVTNDTLKEKNLFNEIIKREEIENTVIGFNFAIPHSKTDFVDKPYVIYAQLENEIEWAKNEELVKYVMLVLVPKKNSDVHIDILKDISTKLINEDFRKKLETVKNISEIYEVLNV